MHSSCDSDGDSTSRRDWDWSYLWHADRSGGDRFNVRRVELRMFEVEAPSRSVALAAAYLTALRTGGTVSEGGALLHLVALERVIPDLDRRLALADEARQKL